MTTANTGVTPQWMKSNFSSSPTKIYSSPDSSAVLQACSGVLLSWIISDKFRRQIGLFLWRLCRGVRRLQTEEASTTGVARQVAPVTAASPSVGNSTIRSDHKYNVRHYTQWNYSRRAGLGARKLNPSTPTVAIWGIKHPVPDRVKPSFVIFDIRALWRSALSVRVPGCQKLQMTA